MEITINPNLEAMLTRLAESLGMTSAEYVTARIEDHLLERTRQEMIDTINSQTVEDLGVTKTAMDSVMDLEPIL